MAEWAGATLGIPAAECRRELIDLYEAGHRRDTFDRWLAQRGLALGDTVERMVEVFRRHDPNICLDGAVAALLVDLRRRYRLGLVSDGYLEVQRKKVAALGLRGYIDAIVLSDELGRDAWKPSILPFEKVLEALSVAGHDAVYVADNPAKDFEGARAVGMTTIRFRRRDGVYGHLEATSRLGSPDREILDLASVEAALAELSAVASGYRR